MGLLWLLQGTAQLHLLRRIFRAWLYAQRLAIEARTALQITAPRRPRKFDIFRYRYLLFAFKFWWRHCLQLRAAMHGIGLRQLGEPEREASPRSPGRTASHWSCPPPGLRWTYLVQIGPGPELPMCEGTALPLESTRLSCPRSTVSHGNAYYPWSSGPGLGVRL